MLTTEVQISLRRLRPAFFVPSLDNVMYMKLQGSSFICLITLFGSSLLESLRHMFSCDVGHYEYESVGKCRKFDDIWKLFFLSY